ncbi:MAG: GerMN domain-containing protein [Candidatus Magasanikbacteria bacterium]|jgi:spore germination protein GerM
MINKNLILWIVGGILVLVVVGLVSAKIFTREDSLVSQGEPIVVQPVSTEVAEVVQYQTVKVFFNNIIFDPGLMDCASVYPVNRAIKPTLAVGRAALEELFRGLVAGESELGYLTNLNTGVKIQKLTIENGIAKVDFSEELQSGVGGSCKVTAIRSQITQTLKQFPTVREVIISIDGNIEDILQP